MTSTFEKKIRLLLVDDDEDDRMIIHDLLTEALAKRFQLDWEPKFDAAKGKIALGIHDAYLIDYRLGEKNGLDLIRESSDDNPAPFILLTGYGDHDVDMAAMKSGVSDYLVKAQLTSPMLERSIRYSIAHAVTIATLREREESMRSLFDAAFEGIFVQAEDGRILDVNTTAAHIFGCSPTDMIGSFLQDSFISSLDSKSKTSSSSHQVLAKRQDGTTVHLEVSSKPYRFRGRPCILTACRDISERVQMEAQIIQQDRMASIGFLASSLAHEIGTPLGVIRGRAELLGMRMSKEPVVRENADIIITQIDRVSQLIRSLLNLARGEKAAALVDVNLNAAVREVLDLMTHEFRKIGAEILTEIPEAAKVQAVQGPLHQVLLNLMVNALHAMQAEIQAGHTKDHRLRIFARERNEKWEVGIADSGCGISKENLKRLFTPFFTTKDFGVGTGLGLATSYRIVEAWGGEIQAQSEEGKGATFVIILNKP